MNVAVVGTGYVGLVAGTCLADFGMDVTCVDIDQDKIDRLNRGEVPIYELGLAELIQRNVKLDRLHFSTDLKSAVENSTVVFLAVGTPEGDGGRPDLRAIYKVASQVGRYISEYKIVAIKSTVPVGTASEITKLIKESLPTPVEFDVVSNPEFLREGAAINDFLRPDRIIIGAATDRAREIMRDVYRPLYLLKKPIVETTNETAELIKYAANSMLALRISFMNEIANLCDKVGADVYDIAVALGMDKRIGPKFLHPGPGFGGSCFPKDVKGLANTARDHDYTFQIVEAIIAVNARQIEVIVEKTKKALGGFKDKTVCLLGLAFKPNTDDIREAPAIALARAMIAQDATVNGYDPAAMDEVRRELPELNLHPDPYTACDKADIVLVVTEWNEFRDLDLVRIKGVVNRAILFDTRNLYDPKQVQDLGYRYLATGRPVN